MVDVASDGREGLHLAMTGNYEFAILDVMLPGIDGWTVLSDLRSSGCPMPELFLTARDRVSDRVRDQSEERGMCSKIVARLRILIRVLHNSGMVLAETKGSNEVP